MRKALSAALTLLAAGLVGALTARYDPRLVAGLVVLAGVRQAELFEREICKFNSVLCE